MKIHCMMNVINIIAALDVDILFYKAGKLKLV
jgi:hypothetical protein